MNALQTARPNSSASAAVAFLADFVGRAAKRIAVGDNEAEVVAALLPIMHADYLAIEGVDAIVDHNDVAHDWFREHVTATTTDDGPNDHYDADRERYVGAGRFVGAKLTRDRWTMLVVGDDPIAKSFRVNADLEDHPQGADAIVLVHLHKVSKLGPSVRLAEFVAEIDEIA